jgi:outer membrane protein
MPVEFTNAAVDARIRIPAKGDGKRGETAFAQDAAPNKVSDPPAEPAIFTLTSAIAFAQIHNPRLRAARAAIDRAGGLEQVAFAPFLPEVGLLTQSGTVSSNEGPGTTGPTGYLIPTGSGGHSYSQTELQLQMLLCDFGRTNGRYRQALAREEIARLQFVRADQTVQFDVSAAYFNLLLARASQRIQEDAVRRAEAILNDTRARRKGGVADRDDVLRAQVQLSETQEALINARESVLAAIARLNNTMGRNSGWPIQIEEPGSPPLVVGLTLSASLERAAERRPEISLVREAIAAAQGGQQAARAEFLPRIYARASTGRVEGANILPGWQAGAGLHLDIPLYSGGRHQGELRAAEADVEAAFADAQGILDAISLEVNLAYRSMVATGERIALSRTAVVQAEENLRLVRVKYRNGNATPTDIVDAETALTRSQQRFQSASFLYLIALARLNYSVGL